MTMQHADILATVQELVVEVAGDELLVTGPLTMQTSFNADLELESIEFVALAERITEEYGKRVNLAAWLATMELDEILGLRVGQLVEFITRCTSPRMTE